MIAAPSAAPAPAAGAPSIPAPAAGEPPAAAAEAAAAGLAAADGAADEVATVAERFSRNVEVAILAQQAHQQTLQLRVDRMRSDFNAAQEERSEMLREMNVLRDMALEQAKKDDEVLKKYVAMI